MGQEDSTMKRRHHTPEQVIRKLAEGDRMLNDGASVDEVEDSGGFRTPVPAESVHLFQAISYTPTGGS